MHDFLRGCMLALDLSFDFALILDVSEHPKVVFLNSILAHKLGCKGGEVDINQQGSMVVQVLALDHKPPTIDHPDRLTGSLRLGYNGEAMSFMFHAVKCQSNYLLCILKEYDECELMRMFFNGCRDVMLGILDVNLDRNNFRNLVASRKVSDIPGCIEDVLCEPLEQKGILQSTVILFMDKIRQVIETKVPIMFDYCLKRGDTEVCGRYSFYYLTNSGPSNKPLVGYVIQDITQQVECEKVLRESQQRREEFERFFIHAPMSMLIADVLEEERDILAVHMNVRHSEGYGLTPEEMAGKRYRKDLGVSQDMIDMYLEKYKMAEHDLESPITFEFSIYRPVYRCVKSYSVIISYVGIQEDTGNKRFAAIMLDITQKRQIEAELQQHKDHLEELVKVRTEELAQSEAKFRTLVTSAPNIILTVDQNGVIQFVNRPIAGCPKDPVGQILWNIFSDVELVHGHISVFLASDSTLKFEAKLNTDIERWYSLCVKMINKNLAIVVATDITEVKSLAEKLNKAMQAKSRFLANMSHEVRTPLSGIIGMSQCLSESSLSGDQLDMVDTIRQCSEVLLTVINDVLDYSKIEAVGLELCPTEVSLVKLLEDSLYMVVAIASRKGLEIVLDVDPDIPDRVIVDVVRIRQIILNILNNAVKFTDVGYIQVTVGGAPQRTDDLWEFSFCVKDTGCGIPPGSETKLFKMFSQLDGSTTRKYGGTGIGLAYARRLIESMDGRIWVKSRGIAGEGSSFYFTLQLRVSNNPDPMFIPMSPLSSFSPRTTPTIVIADPLDVSRAAIKRRLVKMGFEVETFPSLEGCQFLFHKHEDRLYIAMIDVALYCDQVNYFNDLPNISIILMSARSPTPPQWTEGKFPLYLHKPLRVVPLTKTLSRSLRRFEEIPIIPEEFAALSAQLSSSLLSNLTASLPSSPPRSLSSSSGSISFGSDSSGSGTSSPDELEAMNHDRRLSLQEPIAPLTILIVEDNIMNQKVIGRIFSRLGYTNIRFANNGKEAIAQIDKLMPDFVIMDVQMPEMDGVECTKRIRAKYGPSWPHIVTVTADVFPEDELKCREAGTTDFLTKPLCVERLKQCLHKCTMQKEQIISRPERHYASI